MANVLFVHGAGFREPSYTNTFNLISAGLRLINERHKLVRCFWGDQYGARQPRLSIPCSQPGATDVSYRDIADALWLILYSDPQIEMRLLPESDETSQGNSDPTTSEHEAQATKSEPQEFLKPLTQARQEIPLLAQMNGLLAVRQREQEAHVQALSRGVISRALAMAYGHEVSEEIAEPLIDDIVIQLSLRHRGVTGLIEYIWKTIAYGMMSSKAVSHRDTFTEYASPVAGDILLYQANGQAIRDSIRRSVLALDGPVVILAHSLGAIAAFEMLVEGGGPNFPVCKLITVGTQVSYLYEIGSLSTLAVGDRLPKWVPPWVNLYDPADLLSYVCEPLFPGRVRDIEITSHQPVPLSHIAYWTNPGTWSAIAETLKGL